VSKFERLVSAGETNVSVSGFNVSCPSLLKSWETGLSNGPVGRCPGSSCSCTSQVAHLLFVISPKNLLASVPQFSLVIADEPHMFYLQLDPPHKFSQPGRKAKT